MIKGVIILSLFIVVPFGSIPDYGFELAWESHTCLPLGVYLVDLDSDGLSEILYTCQTAEEGYTLTALDTFSTILWEVPVGDYLSILSGDIENDGFHEVFVVTQITSLSEEMDTHRGERQLTCFNSEGALLWRKTITVNTEWDGYLFDRYNPTLADITNDGYNEIMVANLILDRNGDILYEYENDYSIIGIIQDSEIKLIMEKEADIFFVGSKNYAAYCRIVTLEGDIIWEKEFLNYTYVHFLEIESKKRLFFVQVNTVTEVDVTTGEENSRIEYDFDYIGKRVLLKFYVLDVDGNGQHEYVIFAYDKSGLGNSALYVYDSKFSLIWKYVDPKFVVDIVDMENDGRYEFLIYYRAWISSYSAPPTLFRVLNYDKSERWAVLLDDIFYHHVVDVDADGETEVVFQVELSAMCSHSGKIDALSDADGGEGGCRYLYIFGPDGVIEKQVKVPIGGKWFYDVDGDGDVELLLRSIGSKTGLCVYTNTRITGPLDTRSGMGTLEEVDVGEAGFRRDFWLSPPLYYRYQRITYFLEHPRHVPLLYKGWMTVFFSLVAILGVVFSLFVVRTFKNGNEWEPLWGWKRAFFYVLLLPISPVGLVYLGYTVIKSSEDCRKALGFVRITRRQLVGSLTVGVIFCLILWIVTFLLAVGGISLYEPGLLERVANLGIVGFLTVITAPIVEEILFSGFFYPLLRKKLGIKLGIVLVSFLFAFLYLELVLVPLFFVGAVIKTYAYERTHCLYVPMILYFISYGAVASGLL